MNLYRAILALGLSTMAAGAGADATEAIGALLQERGYEVEVIVFERLDVLDVNSPERLTQTVPRAWPNNLLEIDAPAATTTDSGAVATEPAATGTG